MLHLPAVKKPYEIIRALVSNNFRKRIRKSITNSKADDTLCENISENIFLEEMSAYNTRCIHSSVSIEKAKRLLGYQPCYNLTQGMEKTKQWAMWANIL